MLPGSCGAARRSVPCPPMPRPCAPASGVRAAWAWCSHSVEAVSDGFHACSWCVAVRPAVRSRPAVSEGLPWVLRGSAHCDGTSGLGDTAASFPAGGGPVREASERLPDRAWKPVRGRRPGTARGAVRRRYGAVRARCRPRAARGVGTGRETGPEQVSGRRRPLRRHVPTACRREGRFPEKPGGVFRERGRGEKPGKGPGANRGETGRPGRRVPRCQAPSCPENGRKSSIGRGWPDRFADIPADASLTARRGSANATESGRISAA